MKQRTSPILEAGIVTVSGPLLAFSLYLLLAGHNQPGGGFAGGLVAGTTVLLVWSAGGLRLLRRVLPIRSTALMGAGLILAVVVGFAAAIPGLAFLESGYVELSVPLVGPTKLVSALLFDVGVYLVIVGITLGLIRSLGEERSDQPVGTEQ